MALTEPLKNKTYLIDSKTYKGLAVYTGDKENINNNLYYKFLEIGILGEHTLNKILVVKEDIFDNMSEVILC